MSVKQQQKMNISARQSQKCFIQPKSQASAEDSGTAAAGNRLGDPAWPYVRSHEGQGTKDRFPCFIHMCPALARWGKHSFCLLKLPPLQQSLSNSWTSWLCSWGRMCRAAPRSRCQSAPFLGFQQLHLLKADAVPRFLLLLNLSCSLAVPR